MTNDTPLSAKQEELIAVGASIAAGCQPCSRFHFRAAQAAGASEEEVWQAVRRALEVRTAATKIMADLADRYLGRTPAQPEAEPQAESSIPGQLIALGAAVAANCATTVETSAIAAWRMGANEAQITTAVKIARAVREMAGKKAEAVLSRLAEASTSCTEECACHDPSGQPASGLTAGCCDTAGADFTDTCQPQAISQQAKRSLL